MTFNENINRCSDTPETRNDRTISLLGVGGFARLRNANILIAGLGGVGGYAAETLVRSGIGRFTLIDADCVAKSNINRQLIALDSTVGQSKAILFAQRFHDINPEVIVNPVSLQLTVENIPEILMTEKYDFIVDAIDTVAPKVELLTCCLRNRIPVISSMGAGGRIDPTKIGYFDLRDTRDDGLAKAVRQRLRKAGMLRKLTVVASTEPPRQQALIPVEGMNKRSSYGTIATIPAIFGLFMANYVIRKLTGV